MNDKKGVAYYTLLVFMVAVILAVSIGFCVGMLWLIFLCFGLEYNPLYGVGLWLVFVLINRSLKIVSNK